MRSLYLLLLTACGPTSPDDSDTGSSPDDTDTDTDTDAPPTPNPHCEVGIRSYSPAMGAEDVSIDTSVTVEFDAPLQSGDYWSLSVSGATGDATLAADGRSATFVPSPSLSYETSYSIQAEVCQDGGLAVFTTEEEPLGSIIQGRTYAISYGTIHYTSPPSTITDSLNPGDWILIQVRDVDLSTNALTAVGGIGNGTVPSPDCANAFDADQGNLASSPNITIGPVDFSIPWSGNTVTIEDFAVTATVVNQGGSLEDLHVTGKLDTRSLGIQNACGLLALAGVSCVPCSDGVPQCAPVDATADQADYYPTVDVIGDCNL